MDDPIETQQESDWLKLKEENSALIERVKELEVQVRDLEHERQLPKQPLPSVYVQLNTTRKALTQLEHEKLLLGEKLMKKEQELQGIQHEQIQRMATLESSILGVETHFELQISQHITKTNEQLQTLFQKASEMETTQVELETKTSDLAEAKKQVIELEEKIQVLESELIQIKDESKQVKESAAKKNASSVKEIETLTSTVSKLELDLQRHSEDNDPSEELEQLVKENSELRTELMEVSSKLVAMEEENDSMRSTADNQGDLLGQCLNLEEELQALRTINHDLEENLSSKKKRMELLQSELRRLRQQMDDIDSRGFGSRKRPLSNVSNQVDALVQAERRYEDLERALANLRLERDALLQDKVSWNKTMHSLIKENKDLSKALNRYKSSMPRMEEKLEKSNSKIMKLQAQVQVYALAYRHPSKGAFQEPHLNEEILNKLIRSQIALAEMDERVIKLRRELHKAVARNMFLVTKLNRLQKQCR